jgi:hypothetical protein
MTFDNIFDAYKEAILASVDNRDYSKVEILNTSMKLLSESLTSQPITVAIPAPKAKIKTIDANSSALSTKQIEDFVLGLLYKKGRINSTDASNLFYITFKDSFTPYDYFLSVKGEPRWKNRFWSVTSNLRKSGVLMPNKGRYVNHYSLNLNNTVAEN